jgi:hypothetical protein
MRMLFVLLLTLVVSAMGFAAEDDAAVRALEKEIISRTNDERELRGLAALTENEKLRKAALAHSHNMALQRTLSHELDGRNADERVKEAGYDYFAVGENVAYNQPTAEDVVAEWMSSPGHRANILNKDFTEIGVGIASDDQGGAYYTQNFGRPSSAGMTANATFTVRNETASPVRVGMVDEKQDRPTTLLTPGGKGQFHVAGMGKLPKMRATSDDGKTREFEIQNGAEYVIRGGEEGLNVSAPEPKREPR